MTPTMELRFVERDVLTGSDGWTTVRVLQQKCIDDTPYWDENGFLIDQRFVWVDVPLVKE